MLMKCCWFFKANSPAVSIDGHEVVPVNNEDALLKAAANQPISVAIDAGGSDFQFYSEVKFTRNHILSVTRIFCYVVFRAFRNKTNKKTRKHSLLSMHMRKTHFWVFPVN